MRTESGSTVRSTALIVASGREPTAAAVEPQNGALAAAEESDAVRLFVERAAAVSPGFALDAQNAGTLMQICRYLDGLPLALLFGADPQIEASLGRFHRSGRCSRLVASV